MYEARTSRELIQPLLVTIGHMNPARWEHIESIFEELGFVKPGSNIDGLIYQHTIKTPAVTDWLIEHWLSVASAFVVFLISTLLLVLIQSRRLVRQRTAQLSESERHWRELINAEPACVKTLDREGRLLTMNPAGLAMIQARSREQVLGHKIVGLIDDEYKQKFLALSERIFAGESGSLVFRLRGLEGREIWAESHAVPFRESHGVITRLLSVTQDLTEQKAEESRNERLQRQLNQRHKMEALGQLSGGIAHDFNNLLGIINGYTSLILDKTGSLSSEKLDLYLNSVLQAGDRARELVAQLLAFSRVDSDDERSLDLGSLINEDVNMLRSLLPSSVEIELSVDKRVPRVLIDPVQVHQLRMNLCINARDAMDGSGYITIKLGWSHELAVECCDCHKYLTGDWVELSVTDTGCGMTEEMLVRIFEPFFTTKAVGDGTGMGLAVVHGIMSGKDRHIVVESSVGEGTTFKLFFPPVTDKFAEQDSQIQTATELRGGRGQNILVVDDEPALANLVGDLYSTHEYQTTVINDSREALEIFLDDPEKYELLLTDQTMPGLTGLELIREVKNLRTNLPVILCSGFRASADDAAIDDLVAEYIGKPYRLNTLLESANRLLG